MARSTAGPSRTARARRGCSCPAARTAAGRHRHEGRRAGRLFVAGRDTGRAFVYDTGTGELLRAFAPPTAKRTLINDVAVTGDAAHFTDSFRPVLFRAPVTADSVGDLEPRLDLTGTPIEYGDGFNLNGIVATPEGRYLLTVQYNTGALYRIDTASRTITPVDLRGALPEGDGLVLDGRRLYAVSGGAIVPVELSQDLTAGDVGEPFTVTAVPPPLTGQYPHATVSTVVSLQRWSWSTSA